MPVSESPERAEVVVFDLVVGVCAGSELGKMDELAPAGEDGLEVGACSVVDLANVSEHDLGLQEGAFHWSHVATGGF